MALQELNDKLHGRELHLDRAREHTPFEPGQDNVSQETLQTFQTTEAWQEHTPDLSERLALDLAKQKKRRKIAIIIGSIAGIILLGGLVLKIRSMLFDEDRVEISFSGPKSVASAEMIAFTFNYGNDNLAALNDATLILSYPESFHPEAGAGITVTGLRAEVSLGTIKRNAHGKVAVNGKFYGSKGELAYIKGTLRFTPNGTTSALERVTQIGVNVASSPLSLGITAPQELATGQEVEYVVEYDNAGGLPFSNIKVKMEYPEGFSFVSAEPRPSEGDAVWYLGNLSASAQGKITIRGVLTGARDEYKHIKGMIGFFQGDGTFVAYGGNERQTRIMASPLSISQTVNGLSENVSANPGEFLRYTISYRNTGDLGMRDAIVTLEADSSLLDMSRLMLIKGSYDQARKAFIWKASDVPELAKLDSGESGEISFSVPVAANVPAHTSIKSVAKIDSPDIPMPLGSNKIVGSDTLYVKLGSDIALSLKGYYQDALLPNTGPIPPIVGQETTYTFRLNFANAANDLTNTRAVVAFPSGIRYTGKSLPESETITFNDRTNELFWDMGTFSPGTGAREISFQIGLTPLPNQVGKEAILVNSVVFTAKDSFTGKDIRVEQGAKTTFLSEDSSVGANGSLPRLAP